MISLVLIVAMAGQLTPIATLTPQECRNPARQAAWLKKFGPNGPPTFVKVVQEFEANQKRQTARLEFLKSNWTKAQEDEYFQKVDSDPRFPGIKEGVRQSTETVNAVSSEYASARDSSEKCRLTMKMVEMMPQTDERLRREVEFMDEMLDAEAKRLGVTFPE
jgi:hypothetical protein